jgi:hypothetical protein
MMPHPANISPAGYRQKSLIERDKKAPSGRSAAAIMASASATVF